MFLKPDKGKKENGKREMMFAWREEQKNKIDDLKLKSIFVFCILTGIIIHLPILTGILFNHDSVTIVENNYDWLVVQGKWFVTPLASLDGMLNIPFLSGIVGIVSYSLAAVLVVYYFNVQEPIMQKIIGVSIVGTPSLATALIYQSSDYFGSSFLIAVIGAGLILQENIGLEALGVVVACISIGAYQANVGVVLIVLLIDILIKFYDFDIDLRSLVAKSIKYVFFAFLATISYYIVLKIIIHVKGITLSSYKSIDSMEKILSPKVFTLSALEALKNFYQYFVVDILGLHSGNLFIAGLALVICAFVNVAVFFYYSITMKEFGRGVLFGVLMFVGIPLCANAVGVLSNNSSFYHITTCAFCLSMVVPSLLCFRGKKTIKCENDKKYFYELIIILTATVTVILNLSWIMQENVVYRHISLINKSYDAKLPILVSAIQNEEGYTSESEVEIIGDAPFVFLESVGAMREFEDYYTLGYGFKGVQEEVYSKWILYSFLTNKYSININFATDDAELVNKTEIDLMPVYPDKGSIRTIDGRIFVKLNENY